MDDRKIAIIHDWLIHYGGAERVLKTVCEQFPYADIYTLIDTTDKKTHQWRWLQNRTIHTSFLNSLPFREKYYRYLLPLMPYAIESFDLSKYDIVLSLSHAVAKGVIIHPHQRHISYIFTPMRYIWDQNFHYRQQSVARLFPINIIYGYFAHKLRIWDVVSSNRIDMLLTISRFVQKRINKSWKKEAALLHPPIEIEKTKFSDSKEDYYITISRLVENKNVDKIIQAFNADPTKKLYIVGNGPLLSKLQSLAKENIVFLVDINEKEKYELLSKARAFVFASVEDFGIAMVEALACGTPVIAYKKSGAQDIVIDIKDSKRYIGVLYDKLTASNIIDALEILENNYYPTIHKECRKRAEEFDVEVFVEKLKKLIEKEERS